MAAPTPFVVRALAQDTRRCVALADHLPTAEQVLAVQPPAEATAAGDAAPRVPSPASPAAGATNAGDAAPGAPAAAPATGGGAPACAFGDDDAMAVLRGIAAAERHTCFPGTPPAVPWFFPGDLFTPLGAEGSGGFVSAKPLLSAAESVAVARELITTLGAEYLPRPVPTILGKKQASPRHVAVIARLGGAGDGSGGQAEGDLLPRYSYRHLPASEHPIVSMALFPLLFELVVERAQALCGKEFTLAHVSLYTDAQLSLLSSFFFFLKYFPFLT
jgi:hypothetical protein